MPHVIIKCWPGRTEEAKKQTAQIVAMDVAQGLQVPLGDVSVSIEEVEKDDWESKVYRKEIAGKKNNLYVKPLYRL